ncbi:ATP-binding protein [Variovorax paradoxus]|nr:ATP-binding protein [Variovorax paradoxus]MBT2303972.1 ATP-binding protein [Variovorax paradoxus]
MADPQRSPKVNAHVQRLNRYLPFSAAHDQIYEEYQTGEDVLDLETEALGYAMRALGQGARCIILTGDAGHGKTHLCRRLLESFSGHRPEDARRILNSECDGKSLIPFSDPARPGGLRIHKDFSEIEPQEAAAFLESHFGDDRDPLVVCANEGRLRVIVNSSNAGPACLRIAELFRRSFSTGSTSDDGTVHIVNLNYQSVASGTIRGRQSLVRRTLQSWVGDGRRWGAGSCGSCSLSEHCPIRRNRTLLAEEGGPSELRMANIERLFATVERLGHVVTIREMLMLVAYFLTAGLQCEDVHRKGQTEGWQHENAFYNLLFRRPDRIPEDRLYKGIPTLAIFRRLDPGAIADRAVDELILNRGEAFEEGQIDLLFSLTIGGRARIVDAAAGIDDVGGSPQSRQELQRESEVIAVAVSALRRRAFFDDAGADVSIMSRLGFRHGEEFLSMLEGTLNPQERVRIKNTVVAGLHGAQGLRMSGTATTLYLVDPAFGRASSDAAIIARSIPTSFVRLLPARDAWADSGSTCRLIDSVDWIDRAVVVRIEEDGSAPEDLSLDMLSFECVTRMASGYISEDFYSHEVRRIRTYLGRLAEHGRAAGQISLFINGAIQSVSLDEGVIQVGGGNLNG